MAPEQAAGRRLEVGPQSDIYSLGAILYFLLTGRPAFQGETPHQTIERMFRAEPVRPRRINPAVRAIWRVICLKCLEKEPRCRYATGAELAEDLGRFLAGEPNSGQTGRITVAFVASGACGTAQ